MHWENPLKPAEIAEQRIISAILEDIFSINSNLPPERELALQLGVTRPTLREALQRLARDGWVEIHQGRQTRIRDYWKEGNLNVLSTLAKYQNNLPEKFITDLLQIRFLLAPTYTKMAVALNPKQVINIFLNQPQPDADSQIYSKFDLYLHLTLTQLSGNPVFTLILNGFQELIEDKARVYFGNLETKKHSQHFYEQLLNAAKVNDPELAETITEKTMQESISFWKSTKNRDKEMNL